MRYPDKTMTDQHHTVLVLDNGNKIVTASEARMAGDFVRILDKDDRELAYWDNEEWKDDPITVMGAILRCAAGQDLSGLLNHSRSKDGVIDEDALLRDLLADADEVDDDG